ncbi:hypothetical protein K435DRAFT_142847 [Dendrothele bispora CBS 962.96]|uniref:Uncharacterized protein n=1 Tax=Dendrothele bispora (strain CBS 962.96) TaxID=1314807 RepID=A0A4V6T5E1_DENBC|nr:hypothetical protein K435DRAFT_142847 [Dendrothele bispora CBS 962.96]
MFGTDYNPPNNNNTVSFPHPHPLSFQPAALLSSMANAMEPVGSSSVTSVPTNPTNNSDLIHGGTIPMPNRSSSSTSPHPMDPVNALDPVDVLNLNLNLGLGAVRDRDREEEQRMREVQWKIVEYIREGNVKIKTARGRGHVRRGRDSDGEGESRNRSREDGDVYEEGVMGTGGWSLESFEMGDPGVEEDGGMWVVSDEGGEVGGGDSREGRERRDEEGDAGEEEREKNMHPLEGSLIRGQFFFLSVFIYLLWNDL